MENFKIALSMFHHAIDVNDTISLFSQKNTKD